MEKTMTTPTPPPWQIPAELTADDNKRPVAEMIDEAARKINASVSWEKGRYGGYVATLKLNGHEVVVEPESAKSGAAIESADEYRAGRTLRYTSAGKLAAAVRGRIARTVATEKKEEEARVESRRRRAAEKNVLEAARLDLVSVFGEEIVEACMTFETKWASFNDALPVARVKVDVGLKITGEKMSVGEAVRFTQAMISAGYNLLKLAEELS